MIRRLTGKIIEKDINSIIIETSGIGYLVFTSLSTLSNIVSDSETTLYTYLSVRENALDLYGFIDKEELNFFELLLTVNGVGPKSAISILSSSNTETLTEGIQSNDALYLSKISGIGKKTAEKIVLALRDKLGAIENRDSNNTRNSDAMDALVSLGYSEKDVRETVSRIKEKDDVEKIIKEALKILSS